MTTASTDPRAIEAEIERDRAALASTLDTLSDRVSVDSLAKQALDAVKRNAGTGVSTLDHAVRANPIGVALIGAGIAWMFLGPRIGGARSSDDYESDLGTSDYGSGSYASGGYNAAPSYAGSSSLGYDATTGTDGGTSGYGTTSVEDDDHGWSREATGLRQRAMAALRRIESEARSYAASIRGGSSAEDRDFDAEREGIVSRFTSDLRDRFSSGLDSLSPEARDRVVAARQRAYGAMLEAERMGRDVVRDPGRVLEEHPLVAGAVAFALGAAAAAALPRTEAEDRAFGSERDRLMGEAAALLRQERGRAMEIAGSLTQEIRSAAQDTLGAVTESARGALGNVAETATRTAQEAAHRVTERATDEVRGVVGDAGGPTTVTVSDAGSSGGSSGLAGPGDPVIR